LMNKAAKILLGTHDFASFCMVHTDVKTTICTITQAQWSNFQQPDGPIPSDRALGQRTSNSAAVFTITADRFLRNMVRAVVGTLFEVGRGKMTLAQFEDVINQRNRCAAGQSVPADGLYLTKITYPE
ncbi:MAG: tRNA pseudouridine synthase A, partial [Paludibacteraceae bacterium]|nr:tRNA pseudouridine synthase A [Paludibacteraceae bacterium]